MSVRSRLFLGFEKGPGGTLGVWRCFCGFEGSHGVPFSITSWMLLLFILESYPISNLPFMGKVLRRWLGRSWREFWRMWTIPAGFEGQDIIQWQHFLHLLMAFGKTRWRCFLISQWFFNPVNPWYTLWWLWRFGMGALCFHVCLFLRGQIPISTVRRREITLTALRLWGIDALTSLV